MACELCPLLYMWVCQTLLTPIDCWFYTSALGPILCQIISFVLMASWRKVCCKVVLTRLRVTYKHNGNSAKFCRAMCRCCCSIFFFFTTVLSHWDFSNGKIGLPSPGKASCNWAVLSTIMVHAKCFSVSIIHQTLTWTTGSLTHAQTLRHVICKGVYGHCKRVCAESWLWKKNP